MSTALTRPYEPATGEPSVVLGCLLSVLPAAQAVEYMRRARPVVTVNGWEYWPPAVEVEAWELWADDHIVPALSQQESEPTDGVLGPLEKPEDPLKCPVTEAPDPSHDPYDDPPEGFAAFDPQKWRSCPKCQSVGFDARRRPCQGCGGFGQIKDGEWTPLAVEYKAPGGLGSKEFERPVETHLLYSPWHPFGRPPLKSLREMPQTHDRVVEDILASEAWAYGRAAAPLKPKPRSKGAPKSYRPEVVRMPRPAPPPVSAVRLALMVSAATHGWALADVLATFGGRGGAPTLEQATRLATSRAILRPAVDLYGPTRVAKVLGVARQSIEKRLKTLTLRS